MKSRVHVAQCLEVSVLYTVKMTVNENIQQRYFQRAGLQGTVEHAAISAAGETRQRLNIVTEPIM